MTVPEASVLMAAYNAAAHLEAALRSVLDQTVQTIEVIVVDDGSKDATPAILARAAQADPRVRVSTLGENLGLAAALNQGLRLCRADVIVRMDADDVALPERIDRQLSFLRENPTIGVVGSQALLIDDRGAPLGPVDRPTSPTAVLWHSLLDNPFIHPTVAVRRAVLRKAGGYDEALRSAQDYELWHRVLRITAGANLPEALLLYRRADGGTTSERRGEQIANHRRVSDNRVAAVVGAGWQAEELELLRRVFVYPEFGTVTGPDRSRALTLYRGLGVAFCASAAPHAKDRRLVRRVIARRVAGTLRSASRFPLLPVARTLPRYPAFLWDLAAALYTRAGRR